MSVQMFEEKNSSEFKKVEILDSSPDERFLPGFKDTLRIDPARYPVVGTRHYLELRSTLDLLKSHGYQPKVFCIAEIHDRNSVFQVESDRFDWIVTPVGKENIEQIPYEHLEGIGRLLEKNINIDGVALAKPQLKEEVSGVIRQELISELKTLSKIAGLSLLLIASAFKIAAGNTNGATESVQSPKLLEIPDPVLLVRINDVWLEIGRW